MKYTGTLITDLQRAVELCLRNARICTVCGKCYGAHSEPDGYCPKAVAGSQLNLPSKLNELRAQTTVVPGTIAPR